MKTILFLIIITTSSCGLLQKSKMSQKTNSQKEELQVELQQVRLSGQQQLVLSDSSNSDYTILLWPKGNFRLSPRNGFEGEAEHILVKAKRSQQKNLWLDQQIEHDSILLKASKVQQHESNTTIRKDKQSIVPSWVWLLAIPVLLVMFWVGKRIQ
ncbi:MAG: hypothetical protein EOO90_17310 [Pedobacter sp.]|nr:MAG: hypothetical protein EOO90_17310 [Pedobacter sp.]